MLSSQGLIAVAGATIAQFIIGAIWYTPLFGKLWGKIHGFDKLSKKVQKEMMSQMGPIFGVQILFTILTSFALVVLYSMLPSYPLVMLTFWVWLGFVVPAHVSGILFGNTDKKWMVTKAAVMAGGSFASLMIGAFVVSMLLG